VPAPSGRADDFVWRQRDDGSAAVAAAPVNVPVVSDPTAKSDNKAEKKPAETKKTSQSSATGTKPDNKPKPVQNQNNAPRPPQPIRPLSPLGWLR